MGVDYQGVICVGYEYEGAQKLYHECLNEDGDLKYEDFYDFCEAEGLESMAPCFNGDSEDSIFGVRVERSMDYCFKEIDLSDVGNAANNEQKVLFDKYGVEPKVYLMARGW